MQQIQTVEIGVYELVGEVTYKVQDDSFDHEFGTERILSAIAESVDLTEAYEDGEEISLESIPTDIITQAKAKLLEEEYTGEFPDLDESEYEPE